ncbi:MAG: BadF/BadG/BcrA/BcrD ATPase family protein, partial [bacterium]
MNTESIRTLGICLGASTISAVELERKDGKTEIKKVMRKHHEGNPKDEFKDIIEQLEIKGAKILITGRSFREIVNLPSITEPEATEYALEFISDGQKYDAVVSAGGETFMVYTLSPQQKVIGVMTGNKCASGTGEFFLQQIKRMNLGLEEAVRLGMEGDAYHVSGRCSVFCKSDCTHALNKGEPVENVTAGLCRMIASKMTELISKVPHENVLVVGGSALNTAVLEYMKQDIENISVPEQAPYFEALGAALAAFEKGGDAGEKIFKEENSGFTFLEPLKDSAELVTFNSMEHESAKDGDICIVGLDVGSTTTKAVLLRAADDKLLGSIYLRTNGNPVEASRNCYKELLKQIKGAEIKITGIGVTGSGRQVAGLYSITDGIINEIIAHAAAAAFFDPEVDTIFEIGGQDAKYTHLTNSVASDYAMNEACSAGTGSFLEESAFESFNIKAEQIGGLALKGDRPPNFNDQCAAFISSDI